MDIWLRAWFEIAQWVDSEIFTCHGFLPWLSCSFAGQTLPPTSVLGGKVACGMDWLVIERTYKIHTITSCGKIPEMHWD